MAFIEGTTKSGFKYSVDERALRDARMWELIDEDSVSSVRVPRILLGEEGKNDLYKFVEDGDGFVDMTKVNEIIGEILTDGAEKNKDLKNSKSSRQ